MDDMIIEATQSSPQIHLSAEQNRLLIKGKSYMENPTKFYEPVFAWLEKYLATLASGTIKIDLEIIYLNSSSLKMFMNLFEMFEESVANVNNDICVNWLYDAENMMAKEYGEELQEELETAQFNLVEIAG